MRTFLKNEFVLAAVFLLLLPALAYPYKKVKCFVITPPGQLLPGVQRIAVLDFETEGEKEKKTDEKESTEKFALKILSKMLKEDATEEKAETQVNYGKFFSSYLVSKLLEKDRGIKEIETGFLGLGAGKEGKSLQEGAFTNVYEIVERTQMMNILKEQELSASGVVAEDQVLQLGNMLGVQAIVMGDVNYYQMDEDYTETRTEKKKDKKIVKKVDCSKRKVHIAVRTRIISAETGQILGSTEAKYEEQKSKCSDQWGTIPTAGEMIDIGLKKLSGQIADYITPHFSMETYELEKIKDPYEKTGEKAAKLAEELKIDEAFFLYQSIYEKDAYNPEALYNLGVVNEVVGNFKKAEEYYEQAAQLKEDDKFKKALKRVQKNTAFAEALTQIGIEIKEHEFQVTEEQKTRSLSRKVKIKGSRTDRVKVYTQPMITSDVVDQVPGGLTFSVIQQEGDWYLIQLLGEKQGYVPKEKVELQ